MNIGTELTFAMLAKELSRKLGLPEQRSRQLDALKRWNARLSALRWLVGDFGPEVLPEYVGFNVTTQCNLSCPHCPSHGTPEEKQAHNDARLLMQPELFRRLAQELLPHAGLVSLTLTGEPMGLPRLEAWLAELHPHGARLHVVTNGTLLTPLRLALLLPLAGVVQLSIDGASRAVFEALRKGASFAAFLHNARVLVRTLELLPDQRAPRLGLTCVGMGSNLGEWPSLVRLAHALGIRWVQISSVRVTHSGQAGEALDRHLPRFNHYRAEALRVGRELGVEVDVFKPLCDTVGADPTPRWATGMLVPEPPSDAWLPPAQLIDEERVEAQARQAAALLRERARFEAAAEHRAAPPSAGLEAAFEELLSRHAGTLSRLRAEPDTLVWHCVHLRQRAHVRFDGTLTTCPVPALGVVGSLSETPIGQLWNGPVRRGVLERFRSDDPHAACRSCVQRRQAPVGDLLAEAFPPAAREAAG